MAVNSVEFFYFFLIYTFVYMSYNWRVAKFNGVGIFGCLSYLATKTESLPAKLDKIKKGYGESRSLWISRIINLAQPYHTY